MQVQQLAAMQETLPDQSLNAGLTGCTAITSPSSPTTTRKLGTRHSSTLYVSHEPRLRLGRGRLGRYSDRLRRAQTTQRRSQASQDEQSRPATQWHPRQSVTIQLQCAPTYNDVRRDVPAAKHCNSFLLPPCAPPLVTIKGRGGQRLQGLDLRKTEHLFKGLGLDTLSRPACNPYYKHS
jgi:hypothetical protein